ncbi:reverse transcriptase domain-containing protein, partial [Priestia endophytica]|uniref:reverse transcriptase domain-containing protein n=1 Tax=Priestia endophytica TaxID=135735 RepID=UPI002280C3B2
FGGLQGGIISPLLSNVVLNELDWWISNQWETFKPSNFKTNINFRHYARKYTNLKDGFIVRYADDFKIMCRTYQGAQRYYHATIDFLNNRLGLDINRKKSKVVNLKKNSSTFLGFKVKLVQQNKSRYGFVAKSSMADKARQKTTQILKQRIKEIQRYPTADNVLKFNITLIGIQNYYKYATKIYLDLTRINYTLLKSMKSRLRNNGEIIQFNQTPMKFKVRAKGIQLDTKVYSICKTPLLPVTGKHHKNPWNFSQDICNYTRTGRTKVHKNLKAIPKDVLIQVMSRYSRNKSIEYNDNRISKYITQYGKCYITGETIGIDRVHCHHKIPVKNGGTDKFNNLVIVDKYIHHLIHMTNQKRIRASLFLFKLNAKKLDKLNYLRIEAGNEPITL